MRKFVFLFMACALLTGATAWAAPGDSCAEPLTILIPSALPYTDAAQTNCGRVNTYAATCLGSYDGGEDIIYELIVASDTSVTITMDPGTTTYTGMTLDDECPPNATTCIATRTGSAASPRVINNQLLVAGTYYIMIDTWPSPACIPSFTLTITAPPPPPPNDTCSSPTVIDISSWTQYGGDTFTTTGSTSAAANDYVDYGACASGLVSPEIVYSFTPPTDLDLVVDICGSSYDTIMVITDGCPVPTSVCMYNDDYCGGQSGFACQTYSGGVTYYIFVEGYNGASGSVVVNLAECGVPIATNEDCGTATDIDMSTWTPGSGDSYTINSTTGASLDDYQDYGTCGTGLTSPEVVFSFTPPTDLKLAIDLCGSAYDTIMVITDGCPVPTSVCMYNDDYCSSQSGFSCQTYTGGVTYYIFVEGYGGASGMFTLNVAECYDPLLECDVSSIFSQEFDGSTVYTVSDYGRDPDTISADDFSGVTDWIGGVEWWGAELACCWSGCTKTLLDYEITFYDDNAGLPGNIVYQEVVTATRAATSVSPFGAPSYGFVNKYSATLTSSVNLTSGWISVAGLDEGTCWFMWGDGGLISGTSDYVQNDGTGWVASGYGADLSFCLILGSAPPNPDDPVCGADPAPICVGQSADVTATASGTDVVRWFDNPGDPVPQTPLYEGTTYNVSPVLTTTYYAWAFDGTNYSLNYCDVMVTVNDLPVATAVNDGPACADEDVQLTGGPDLMTTYAWTGPGGFTSALQSPLLVAPVTGGVYSLIVTDGNGCVSIAADTTVTVNPLPDCTISAPATVIENITTTVSAPAGATTYAWVVTGNGTITSTAPYGDTIQILAGPLTGGTTITVDLVVTDANSCSCTAAPATITVVGVPPVPATGPAGLALLLLALGGLLGFTRRK